jgi:DNA-binding transcriptional ArsR family regulator
LIVYACTASVLGQRKDVRQNRLLEGPGIGGVLVQHNFKENRLTNGNHMVTYSGNHMVSFNSRRRDSIFRAISDPTRREILNILRADQQTVGGIAHNFRMSRPAISKHLRVLRSAGLVETRKHGTQTHCRLNAKPLQVVNEWLRDYETFWKESLQSLKKHLEEES